MVQHKVVNTRRFFGASLVVVLTLLVVLNAQALFNFSPVKENTRETFVSYDLGAGKDRPFQPKWVEEYITNAEKPDIKFEGFLQEGDELYVKLKNYGVSDEKVEVILTYLDTGMEERNYIFVNNKEAIYSLFFLDEEPGEHYVQIRLEVDNVEQDVAHFPVFM